MVKITDGPLVTIGLGVETKLTGPADLSGKRIGVTLVTGGGVIVDRIGLSGKRSGVDCVWLDSVDSGISKVIELLVETSVIPASSFLGN